ncbi:MAG: FAD-dependent oxidoreductase [Defluviitaleaceae bacterium]|nr:FAD-dependent oxidoreductase [Defluviitaleaceae bacterium]
MTFSQATLDKAKKIAEECQGSYDAYCSSRCPMRTDAKGYVNLISAGMLPEALQKIREKLFLPGTLGRICAHPCEEECRRETEYGQPIAIAALKRYAADKADDEKLWNTSKKPATGKKAAIIGAGPAGAQAAIDLAREGHDVTVYERLNVVGGMMRVGIPEYRLPRNIIDYEYSYLAKLGVQIKLGVNVGRDMSLDDLAKNHDVVIVANGAHKGFVPPVKGVDVAGVTNAADFLREVSLDPSGVKVGNTVLVVGGGDVAMDCARSALRLGAANVYVVSLEKLEDMPASKHEQEGSLEEGIAFYCGWGGEEIQNNGGNVSGIRLKECTSVFDADGRFSPAYSDERMDLECDMLIFATGQIVEDISGGTLPRGGGGRYNADAQTMATSLPNVFVAGDCAGATIVVEAMALGRKAAISANRYLSGQGLTENRDFASEHSTESALSIPLPESTQDLPRKHTNMLDPAERIKSFIECDLGFSDEDAAAESGRCLECECKKCMAECIMLTDYTTYPGEMFKKFLKDGNMDPLVAYSCNMCDQCTIVCPEEFKFAELFGAIRKELVKANGGQSPIPGHKAINMHQKLGFSKFFTIKMKGGKK